MITDEGENGKYFHGCLCCSGGLISSGYSDGLAFGVVELVHGADVHDHRDAPGEDEGEQECDKETRPDRGSEVLHGVHGFGERL